MDLLNVAQVLFKCVQENYPQITGAVLQVIGGATILFRVLGSQKVGVTPTSSLGMGNLLTMLQKVALNK